MVRGAFGEVPYGLLLFICPHKISHYSNGTPWSCASNFPRAGRRSETERKRGRIQLHAYAAKPTLFLILPPPLPRNSFVPPLPHHSSHLLLSLLPCLMLADGSLAIGLCTHSVVEILVESRPFCLDHASSTSGPHILLMENLVWVGL